MAKGIRSCSLLLLKPGLPRDSLADAGGRLLDLLET
jgi:hypothetical protein